MKPDVFLEKLAAAERGELTKESVLHPFLHGLEQLLAGLERSLELQPEDLTEFLAPNLEDIEDGLQACEEQARKCLSNTASRQDFLELGQAHSHLNGQLMDYHQQSWIYRGPTKVDWLNMLVDGGERFLAGQSLPRHLGALLDEHVAELELRQACEPGFPEGLMKVLSQFSTWCRSTDSLSRLELEDLMTKTIGYGERFEAYLTQRPASLAQLLVSLEGDVSADEIVWLFDSVLTDLRRIRADFESALADPRTLASQEMGQVDDTLSQLESAIGVLAESGDEVLGEKDIEDLHQLRELLESEIETFQKAIETEQNRRLPDVFEAPTNEAHSDPLTGEARNVHSLRRACARFQEGELTLEQLRDELAEVRKTLALAIAVLPASTASCWRTPDGEAVHSSLQSIEQGLNLLGQVSGRGDASLQEGLSLLLAGAKTMGKRDRRDTAYSE